MKVVTRPVQFNEYQRRNAAGPLRELAASEPTKSGATLVCTVLM